MHFTRLLDGCTRSWKAPKRSLAEWDAACCSLGLVLESGLLRLKNPWGCLSPVLSTPFLTSSSEWSILLYARKSVAWGSPHTILSPVGPVVTLRNVLPRLEQKPIPARNLNTADCSVTRHMEQGWLYLCCRIISLNQCNPRSYLLQITQVP